MEFQRFSAPDPAALDVAIVEARARLAHAIALQEALGIVEHVADLGAMLTTARQEATALALLQEHSRLAESLPGQEPTGWYWNAYATAMQYSGLRTEANAVFAKALALCQSGGWRRLQSFVLQHWGRSLVEQGQLSAAEVRFSEALAIRKELNDPRQASTERCLSALVQLRTRSAERSTGGQGAA